MPHPGFQALSAAKQAVLAWAKDERLALHTIEFVATFEEWDGGIGVWVFYDTDANLERGAKTGANSRIQERLLAELRSANYPFSAFPEVLFEFDSDENVRRNYKGSYLYRLR